MFEKYSYCGKLRSEIVLGIDLIVLYIFSSVVTIYVQDGFYTSVQEMGMLMFNVNTYEEYGSTHILWQN